MRRSRVPGKVELISSSGIVTWTTGLMISNRSCLRAKASSASHRAGKRIPGRQVVGRGKRTGASERPAALINQGEGKR